MKKLVSFLTLLLPFYLQAQTQVGYDDFSSTGKYFADLTDAEYTGTTNGGYFKINIIQDGAYWFYHSFDVKPEEENYTVEATMEAKSGPGSSQYGLTVGMYNDNSNYVIFLVDREGKFTVKHYYSKEYHTRAEKQSHSAIKTTGKNVLKVVRKFNICEYYINGIMVHADAERNYHGSRFGFFTEGTGEVWVDEFKLYKTTKDYNLVPNAISGRKKIDMGANINTDYDDLAPVIAPDGKTFFLTVDGSPENVGGSGQDVWQSNLDANGNWTPIFNMGYPINNTGSNYLISIAPDNNTIYIGNTYKSNGESLGAGMSVSHKTENGWEVPTSIEIKNYENKNKYSDFKPDASNRFIIMAIENSQSIGLKDFFISFKQEDGSYSTPKNMGNVINSIADEFGAILAADGKTLYFNSYGHSSYGSADVFMSKRLDDTWTNWSKPQNLGPEINSDDWEGKLTLAADGKFGYISSAAGVANGKSNIFKFELGSAAPDPVLLIKGKVLNSKTNEPLAAEINYSDLSTNNNMGFARSDPKTGEYQIVLPVGKNYGFLADKMGFYPISDNIDVKALTGYTVIERDLYLTPIEVGEKIRLNNLFFDTDKYDLKLSSGAELKRLIAFMNTYPNMEIEISGYTDNKGTDEHNMALSQSRVNSVISYLTKNGISASRLKGKGYGKENPVATNDTEEGRAKNRRVEFTILKK